MTSLRHPMTKAFRREFPESGCATATPPPTTKSDYDVTHQVFPQFKKFIQILARLRKSWVVRLVVVRRNFFNVRRWALFNEHFLLLTFVSLRRFKVVIVCYVCTYFFLVFFSIIVTSQTKENAGSVSPFVIFGIWFFFVQARSVFFTSGDLSGVCCVIKLAFNSF